MVVLADTYRKSFLGYWYIKLRVSMTFSQFLFRFLNNDFYDFCYDFYSLSLFCQLLKFYYKDYFSVMCVISLFLSVTIVFVFDGGWFWAAATSGVEPFVRIVTENSCNTSCNREARLECCSSPRSTSSFTLFQYKLK